MNTELMETTAWELVAPGKGILAADESTSTMEKRFQAVGVGNTLERRRAYREMLFTAPGLEAYISGVILYDETLRQQTQDGTSFVDLLARHGIIPGIKVDKGAKLLAGFPGERITEGLDGLRDRLNEYARLGARFSKWRAVITLGKGIPSSTCIAANCQALARFAALSQEAGILPIVEPEVLMDGDHTLARHAEVTEFTLRTLFHELAAQRVHLEALLLKANMVLSGMDCSRQETVAETADATLQCLRRTVPSAVPGIVFLSGGQGDVRATENLDALNRMGNAPWQLSFSYGRALQAQALKRWAVDMSDVPDAHEALLHRARCNSAARFGRYSTDIEASTEMKIQ
jgi:fructose-bisphosphate aldolase class I